MQTATLQFRWTDFGLILRKICVSFVKRHYITAKQQDIIWFNSMSPCIADARKSHYISKLNDSEFTNYRAREREKKQTIWMMNKYSMQIVIHEAHFKYNIIVTIIFCCLMWLFIVRHMTRMWRTSECCCCSWTMPRQTKSYIHNSALMAAHAGCLYCFSRSIFSYLFESTNGWRKKKEKKTNKQTNNIRRGLGVNNCELLIDSILFRVTCLAMHIDLCNASKLDVDEMGIKK